MGYNSTIMVCNDALDTIAQDKDFGKKLAQAILAWNYANPIDVSAKSERCIHVGAAQVIESHHADHNIVVSVSGNCGQILGYGGNYREDKVGILKNIAESMGYTLRKKPVKKVKHIA